MTISVWELIRNDFMSVRSLIDFAWDWWGYKLMSILLLYLFVLLIFFCELFSIWECQNTLSIFGALLEWSTVWCSIIPLISTYTIELVIEICSCIGISILEDLFSLAVFMAIIELSLICSFMGLWRGVKWGFRWRMMMRMMTVHNLTQSISLSQFVISNVDLSTDGRYFFTISIHESVEEIPKINWLFSSSSFYYIIIIYYLFLFI